jgi:hypothetical protein
VDRTNRPTTELYSISQFFVTWLTSHLVWNFSKVYEYITSQVKKGQ